MALLPMVLEATGAPGSLAAPTERLGSGGAARQHLLSQLMTYRSLFVVASGQNACAACLLLSRRNNRRKDERLRWQIMV